MREGMCTACKEWTQVPGSCCGRAIDSEGSMAHDDDFCSCEDCELDDEKACEFDCEGSYICKGCADEADAEADREFDIRAAKGMI